MSNNEKKDGKRAAEESVVEKIYKKIKKLEDYYNSLKVSTSCRNGGDSRGSSSESTKSHNGGEVASPLMISQKDGDIESASSRNSSTLNEILKLIELDGPNTESDSGNQNESTVASESLMEESKEDSIDEEALRILGEHPSSNAPKNFLFHSNLASRWKAWIVSGLDKDTRVSLLREYSRERNCPLEAPILNPEIASLNETVVKRDNHFIDSQCLVGSAMSALGSAITLLLNEKSEGVDRNELLKLMCDSGKLLAQLHHKESLARKAYILPGLDKKAKAILGKTETDKYLFGENLAEKLKSAKAVEKAGPELKPQSPTPTPKKAPLKTGNQVNWKGPPGRFQRNYQGGNNQRGHPTSRQSKGQSQQENWKPPTSEQNQKQPSKGKK